MNRKAFLKNSLFGTAGIGLALNNLSCDSMKKITILHTNDVHSHIEPFSKDHSEFPNKGGFERRSTIINKIRTYFGALDVIEKILFGSKYLNINFKLFI